MIAVSIVEVAWVYPQRRLPVPAEPTQAWLLPGWRPDFWQPTPLGIEGPWRFFFQLDGDEGWLDDRTPSTSARSSLLLLARLLFEEFAGTPYAEYFATGDS